MNHRRDTEQKTVAMTAAATQCRQIIALWYSLLCGRALNGHRKAPPNGHGVASRSSASRQWYPAPAGFLLPIRVADVDDAVLLTREGCNACSPRIHRKDLAVITAYAAEHDARLVRRCHSEKCG